ncbi:hypothetical protein D9O50_09560 [Oxalobacteraceae bacterium CAVE-383]|nr:hypothetical protein D9O50_09560 [Oxalobacteraceae bacterium CAVE-383]
MGHLLLQQIVPSRPVGEDELQEVYPYLPKKIKKEKIFSTWEDLPTNVRQLHATRDSASGHRNVTMALDINAADAQKLRQLAASVCGDNLLSIRISTTLRTKNVRIWLSLKNDAGLVDVVMTTIMRHLSKAQFGRFRGS